MGRRTNAAIVAAHVAAALTNKGVALVDVAEATDIPLATLESHLNGTAEDEFTWDELVRIGGFLHFSPAMFFEGVAA